MDDAEVARCAPLPRSGSPFALAGSSAVEPYGPKSLCEQGSPPESVVAGETIAFQVQLRDALTVRGAELQPPRGCALQHGGRGRMRPHMAGAWP